MATGRKFEFSAYRNCSYGYLNANDILPGHSPVSGFDADFQALEDAVNFGIGIRHIQLSDVFLDTDAVPMTKAEIRFRRREAIEMYRAQKWYEGLRAHNRRVLTGGRSEEAIKAISSLPERLARAPKPADQAVLHRQISSVFLPRRWL